MKYRITHRRTYPLRKVIVVGPGSVAAVAAGLSLGNNLPLVNQAAALQEYSNGFGEGTSQRSLGDGASKKPRADSLTRTGNDLSDGGVRGLGPALGLDDLRPVEASESLTEALRMLRPFGVLVLRR